MKVKLLTILLLCGLTFTYGQVSDFAQTNFNKANNIATLHKGASLKNLPILAYQLTHKLNSDEEKFRAIFVWVCQNISIDYNQGRRVIAKRKRFKTDSTSYNSWNNSYIKQALKRLINQKKGVCTGYAYLVKTLCFYANLECKIINGYARNAQSNTHKLDLANHSWNSVKLNNKWYLADATWACGYIENNSFVRAYNDGYFLSDPLMFAQNHYPLNKQWLLNKRLSHSDFFPQPIVYNDTFKHQIRPISPMQLTTTVKQGSKIYFSFQTHHKHNENSLQLISVKDAHITKLHLKEYKTTSNTMSFKSELPKKGTYDVHLLIDNAVIASYTFNVSSTL